MHFTSELRPCPTGVPQGSILCPILFLLYVNELPQYTGNQNCNIFADDAMIYSFGNDIKETQANLQSALNSLAPWYRANRRNINTNKSAVMLVGKYSQVNDASISININDVPLEQVNVTKYLGVLVDGSMSWRNQCDNLCSRIAGKITVLRRLRSFVKPNTLKLLYEKTNPACNHYACSVWRNTKKGNIVKLQRAQNYAARIISGNFDYINIRSIDLLRSLRWATFRKCVITSQLSSCISPFMD